MTVMQCSEGLSDRQVAEAVRARIDWKYALGLQLSDPGFNFSVLSEFRSRLVEGGKERLLLEKMLEGCKERGYLKVRGRQRTDSTHVLGSLRILSKWERTLHCLPSRARHKILSNNSLERVNKEIKRRTNVVSIFPTEGSVIRLVGSVLLEQHEDWQVSKRYFSAGSLAKLNRGEERMAEQPQLVAN